jgi:small subunit ribosomal protein S3
MIERKFVSQNKKEFHIQEFIFGFLKNSGCSHIKLIKTPLGDKVMIYTSRPGVVVGRKGQNIKAMTEQLKQKFELENPQIEIVEIKDPYLNAQIVADMVASFLMRFGPQRFKGIAHKTMASVISSGARGVELVIAGKIPGARAKTWRFSVGYLKKCGDVALEGILSAYADALLKAGTIGIQVKIMPPDLVLPDNIEINPDFDFTAIEETVKDEITGKEKTAETKIDVEVKESEPATEDAEETKSE